MAKGELTLGEIKEALSKIKNDIARKEGERDSILKSLTKEFKAKNLDDLYNILEGLNKQCDDLSRERTNLSAEADKLLIQFGY